MKNEKNRILFVLFLALGFLITFQSRILSVGVKYVGVENLQETYKLVEREKAEIAQISAALAVEKEKMAIYQDPTDVTNDELMGVLEKRKKELETFVSYTNVEGPGVIVIIDDAKRDLFQGEDGNNVLVHDQDVGIIVDELRAAGAEAISINGKRIVYRNTKIVCVGPTVKVNGEQMAAPFIIRAIGNRKYLEAAITAPGSFSQILESYGLFVEVNTSISVTIDKYEGEIENQYLQVYEEGVN